MKEEKQRRFARVDLKHSLVMGKRESVKTPSSSWRFVDSPKNGNDGISSQCRNVSARKLGANLWETFAAANKGKEGAGLINSNKKHESSDVLRHIDDFQQSLLDQVQSDGASSLRSDTAASSLKCRVIKGREHQTMSFTSHASSVQVASYDDTVDLSAMSIQKRESGHRLETSAELLKGPDRVWSLEKELTSHKSEVKALQVELQNDRVKIKALLKDPHEKQIKTGGLRKQAVDGNRSRKTNSQHALLCAIQCLEVELYAERRCRKYLESINRRLAQEVAEAKMSCSDTLKELEKERSSGFYLEDLCDKLAKGIINCKSEVRSSNPETEILCISEAWRDARMHSKLRLDSSSFIKNAPSRKLKTKAETFVSAKNSVGFKTNGKSWLDQEDIGYCRPSSESVFLNESGYLIPVDVADFTENDMDYSELLHKRASSRTSNGSSKATDKASARNSQSMVQLLIQKYSMGMDKKKSQTYNSGREPFPYPQTLSADHSSPVQQVRSRLTTSPVQLQSLGFARESKNGSLKSHLLQAKKHHHHYSPI